MTRVLAFCDYFEPPMGGGTEIVSAEVYARLEASPEFSITVVSGVPGRKPAASTAADARRDGPRVVRSRGIDMSRLTGAQLTVAPGLPFSALRAIRRDDPHVIHASSIHFFGSLFGAAISRFKKIPLVTTCHLSGLDALPPRTRALTAMYERTLGRFILNRSSRVIAVSEAVRDHVISLGIDPRRIEVIENGVDQDRFRPGSRDTQIVQICFVGRLIANKGPTQLLDAFDCVEASQARLVLVGDGPLQPEVSARAEGDDRIDVLGHRDDVAEILGRSDIFVRPSTTEGRSLAILEAMAAGCAVVASDIPANAELVRDGETGILVPVGDAAALGAALTRLVGDRGLRERLGHAAREQASRSTWEMTSGATGTVLVDACRKPGS